MSVLSSILCSISLFAQTGSGSAGQFDGYDFSTFTINGLEIGGPEYTEQDIVRTFGQPDTVMFDEFGYIFLIGRDLENCRYAAEITLYSKPKGPIMTAYAAHSIIKTAREPYSGGLQEQDGKMWSFSIARNSPMTKTGS